MNETNSGRFGDWAKWSRSPCDTESELLSESELRRREHENLLATLHKTRWKIKSADGAAELLKIKLDQLGGASEKDGYKASRLRMRRRTQMVGAVLPTMNNAWSSSN
jgi:hypothetical protein